MGEAFFWGAVGGVSLVVGAAVVFVVPIGRQLLGAIMAFGAGVLISAVSFELVEEAVDQTNGDWSVALGMFCGAITFFAGDWWIDNRGGRHRKSMHAHDEESNSKAILLGTVLDGVPESVVIGLGLAQGGAVSAAMVAAVFLSNLPESISSTTGLRASGWSSGRLLLMWSVVALVAGIASLLGYTVFENSSDETIAFVMSFAGGALLTMLADTMMPKAFELEGKLVGLLTTLGFAVAFAISAVS
ncbi:MAG: ZIP family zinc transporter [Actinobacteria bacterium]|nr:ZIP family zinc transporter [Actinomycetota bacterium]